MELTKIQTEVELQKYVGQELGQEQQKSILINKKLNEKVNDLEMKLARLFGKRQNLNLVNEKIGDLEGKFARLLDERQTLQQKIHNLQQSKENTEPSNSYRMSAPLGAPLHTQKVSFKLFDCSSDC